MGTTGVIINFGGYPFDDSKSFKDLVFFYQTESNHKSKVGIVRWYNLIADPDFKHVIFFNKK